MCELAVESADWLMVDHWEAKNTSYIPTAKVLDHFNHEVNEVLGGAEKPDGTRVPMRIVLLAGADREHTVFLGWIIADISALQLSKLCLHQVCEGRLFCDSRLTEFEGVWSPDDLNHILGVYGAFIVERQGTDIDDALSSLEAYRKNIYVSTNSSIAIAMQIRIYAYI
jgi:nicotinamide mononucleotide adenylyltransferase